jgi:hypothetical protein
MAVLGTAYEKIGSKAEGAETGVDSLASYVSDWASSVKEEAKKTLSGGEAMASGVGTGMLNKKGDIENASKDVGDAAIGGVYDVLDLANGKSGEGEKAGKFYDIGIASGIDGSSKDVLTSISDLTGGMITAANDGLGEHSPSKIAADQGYNYGLGMANGLDDSLAEVSRAVSSIADTIIFGMPNNLYGMGQEAASSFARGMRSIHISTPHMYIRSWNYNDLGNGGYQYTPNWAVQWYANGGFPNRGDMFIANENGPEMIGRMGSKNVVANNKQITDGIRAAVVDGMMEVMMANRGNGNGEAPFVMDIKMVTPDGEVLARQVEKGRARRNDRFNPVGLAY